MSTARAADVAMTGDGLLGLVSSRGKGRHWERGGRPEFLHGPHDWALPHKTQPPGRVIFSGGGVGHGCPVSCIYARRDLPTSKHDSWVPGFPPSLLVPQEPRNGLPGHGILRRCRPERLGNPTRCPPRPRQGGGSGILGVERGRDCLVLMPTRPYYCILISTKVGVTGISAPPKAAHAAAVVGSLVFGEGGARPTRLSE